MSDKSYLERAQTWRAGCNTDDLDADIDVLLSAITHSKKQASSPDIADGMRLDLENTITFLINELPCDVVFQHFPDLAPKNIPADSDPESQDLLLSAEEDPPELSKEERESLFSDLINSGAITKGIPTTLKSKKSCVQH